MFITTPYSITNTPSNTVAAYNTWTWQVNGPAKYQVVPSYYIDEYGVIQKWDSWKTRQPDYKTGISIKATPTRTATYTQREYN